MVVKFSEVKIGQRFRLGDKAIFQRIPLERTQVNNLDYFNVIRLYDPFEKFIGEKMFILDGLDVEILENE